MFTLRPYQQQAVQAVYDYLRNRQGNPCVVLPTGCHAVDHPILMYDGTMKRVQNVKVGDLIMGNDSTPRKVVALCRGREKMYRIVPLRGESFVVNENHILSLVSTKESNSKNYPYIQNGGEITNITIREYLTKSRSWRHLRKLYRVPVNYNRQVDLPIPPYILGLLLGDGCLAYGVSLTSADDELGDEFIRYAQSIGCSVSVRENDTGVPSYQFVLCAGAYNPLSLSLENMGLLGLLSESKFIPHDYLVASRSNRLQMLAGLMDSDGYLSSGGFDYVSKSKELADGIAQLARSLGFRVCVSEKYSSCQTGAGGWYFRLHIYGDISVIPCRRKKHIKQKKPRKQKKNVLRTGFTVEELQEDNFYGFTLDGNHLYVDGNFFVHHNSGKSLVLAQICSDAVNLWNGRVLIVTHVKELVEQNSNKVIQYLDEDLVGIYSAGLKRRDTEHPVIAASIQSIYKRACELGAFDLVIVDECFPAGTMISTPRGDIPIENLYIGQPVHTALGVSEIEAISARPTQSFIELEFDNGNTIRCTPNHPFFTEQGWKQAETLEVGSRLFSKEDMQALREDVSTQNILEHRWNPQGMYVRSRMGKEVVLQSSMFGTVQAEAKGKKRSQACAMEISPCSNCQQEMQMLWENFSPLGQAGPRRQCYQLHERIPLEKSALLFDILLQESRECDVDTGRKGKGKPNTQEKEYSAENQRRQWSVDKTAKTTSRKTGAGMVCGVCGHDRSPSPQRIAQKLQAGHSQSKAKDSHRTGRYFTCIDRQAQGRQAANEVFAKQRVARITHIKCESPVPVFNLQVKGHPSYYANGILAHNCHLIPESGEGMYRAFFKDALILNPSLRVIGLTATPYRMATGMICGPENLLNEVCFEVGIRELIVAGYLCPLKSKASRRKVDTSNLHLRGGEFINGEVEQLMDDESLVNAACNEIVEQTRNRNSVLIFAAGIGHARHIQKILSQKSQMEVGLVTGNTPSTQRDEILIRFKGQSVKKDLFGGTKGPIKYLVNVNVLTTGFDAPNIDCVVLLRPTNSPGLYYQACGRGFRLYPSKEDCLVLDFGGNILRHGPVDALEIKEKSTSREGQAPAKECPECHLVVHAGYSKCPECGYEFPPPEGQKHDSSAATAGILSGQTEDVDYDVLDVNYHYHIKRNAGPDDPATMRVEYQVGIGQWHSEWVCPEHTGFARQKFENWWNERSMCPPPQSVSDAVSLAQDGALAITKSITVRTVAGKPFDRIIRHEIGEKPEYYPEPGWNDCDDEQDDYANAPAGDDWYDDDEIPF